MASGWTISGGDTAATINSSTGVANIPANTGSSSVSYTVRYEDANGCTASTTYTVPTGNCGCNCTCDDIRWGQSDDFEFSADASGRTSKQSYIIEIPLSKVNCMNVERIFDSHDRYFEVEFHDELLTDEGYIEMYIWPNQKNTGSTDIEDTIDIVYSACSATCRLHYINLTQKASASTTVNVNLWVHMSVGSHWTDSDRPIPIDYCSIGFDVFYETDNREPVPSHVIDSITTTPRVTFNCTESASLCDCEYWTPSDAGPGDNPAYVTPIEYHSSSQYNPANMRYYYWMFDKTYHTAIIQGDTYISPHCLYNTYNGEMSTLDSYEGHIRPGESITYNGVTYIFHYNEY